MTERKQNQWTPVDIDYSSMTMKDFETFAGLEELNDYEVIKADNKKKRKSLEVADGNSSTLRSEKNPQKKKVSKKRKMQKEVTEAVSTTENCEMSIEKPDMSAWCNLHVPEEILLVLRHIGFYHPTEIQQHVLVSAIRDHLDILAAAETGSGKTLAFGIPILTHIMAAKEREKTEQKKGYDLKALILTPTRELAIQVKNHILAIAKFVDIKVITILGGMSQEKQKRLLQKSPDIIVATPGRLWQLMEEGEPYLEQIPFIRYLVIDEADRMVEQGHFEELTKVLEILNDNKSTKRRQNFVFSATLTLVHDLPERLKLKAKKIQEKNKLESLMQAIGVREKPKIIDITKEECLVETLTEAQITCSLEDKDLYLYYFIATYPGRTLVFCNSISSVRRLKSVLEYLECRPLTLHASMHQKQRLKNLELFTASDTSLLLATDVAARGLDIKGIEHVVHFQVPHTAEIYIHRSGRTARAHNIGLSLMLIEPQEAVFYRKICKTLNKDTTLQAFPIDSGALKIVRERVALARHLDVEEHRENKSITHNQWFLKAAQDMDIDMDELDEKDLLNELGNSQERALKSRQIKSQKKQLSILLKRPIFPKYLMGSYPTKSGRLLLPKQSGSEKAIQTVQRTKKEIPKPKRKKLHRKNKN